ncbi:MAG: hypothetical protein VYA71_01865, partial [Pseudomonadota bacterium]|nr:hypothetical protein [Pseudomonadota bacterium]
MPATTHRGYQLYRMPYCASFRAGRFDFVMASAHIYFGKPKKERLQREEEISQLAKFIKRRSKTERNKVFDRDFFVVGDFNIEAAGDMFFDALVNEDFVMPNKLKNLGTNFARSKTFDKIVWVDRPLFHFTNKLNVVPFGDVLFRDKRPKGGKKQISDYLPLWAEFEINSLSQELD